MKKENLVRQLWSLFVTFAKVGVLTFGGGYAMLPMLEREVVRKKKWATEDEVINYFAVGQCTPGVIAVNTATFIGYKQRGIPGGIAATLGVVFPSVVIITVIAAFIKNFADIPAVIHAFAGIRAVVTVLVVNAVVKFFKAGCKDLFGVIVAAAAFVVAGILGISSIYVVIGALVSGIASGAVFKRNTEEKEAR